MPMQTRVRSTVLAFALTTVTAQVTQAPQGIAVSVNHPVSREVFDLLRVRAPVPSWIA
jgi:hypothetical protein